MAFQETFETLYKEVIQKQAEAAGFDAHKIDEKPGPGVVFQDMQQAIERAAVVIAEITPRNPNVFYEVGYAHALGKPTILLARRGSELPFDIRSYRVVFYDDTIGGKPE
jgi:nucleoside 2-deoxyribosyltransferase